jgi:hypothetical protein
MGSLSNLYISQSYTSLAHLGTNNALVPGQMTMLEDGLGQSLNISFDGTNISSSGNIFAANITASVVDTGSLVTTASFNSYTQSTDIRLTNIESTTASLLIETQNLELFSASALISINALSAATASYVTETESGSFLITASFSGNTLTFTKGNNTTFGVVIPDISGSTINTGSFATTGSNTFIGNQTISGSLAVSGAIATTNNIAINAGAYLATNEIFARTQNLTINGMGSVIITNFAGKPTIIQTNTEITGALNITGNLTASLQEGYVWVGDENGISTTVATSSFATTGSNVFVGNQTISGSLFVSGSEVVAGPVTASRLQINGVTDLNGTLDVSNDATFRGNVLIQSSGEQKFKMRSTSGGGVSQGFDLLIQTSSFIIRDETHDIDFLNFDYISSSADHILKLEANRFEMNSGSLGVSGSFTASLAEGYVWVGNASNISTLVATSSFGGGGTIDTGSFATTGSNTFTGDQTLIDEAGNTITLSDASGSLMLVAKGFTSSSLHLSASAAGNTNVIFKTNSGNPDTIVSGSSNIFTNPANVTAGFKRYIGGSQNYYGFIPQLTGSTTFSPVMSNNIINTAVIMRTPISSSAYTMNGNLLMNPAANGVQFGPAAAQNFERAVSGLGFNNNFVNGTITATAFKTPLSGGVNISNNNIGATVTLNMDSSSVSFINNIAQGALTVNNSYYPSTYNAASALLGYNGNISLGTNIVFASGSNTTFPGPPRTIINTAMIGTNNVLSASLNGDNSQIHSTSLLGQGLIALGTNTRPLAASAADWGSVFVGRWNAIDGVKDQTAETIFAVGTGRGAALRKTGFLIDSGSNTFVEGTFNVSGSNTFNGTTTITGSLIVSSSAAGFNRINTLDVTQQRIATSLAFTGSRFGGGILSNSIELENLNATQFGFNQLDLNDSLTGTQFILETNEDSLFSEIKLNTRYNGQSDAQIRLRNTSTGASTLSVDAATTNINGTANITQTLKLSGLDPLPTGETGMLAVSQSLLWFYDATQWRQVSLV